MKDVDERVGWYGTRYSTREISFVDVISDYELRIKEIKAIVLAICVVRKLSV